jgi:branched-chain amino acid transport system substrate-binding protein
MKKNLIIIGAVVLVVALLLTLAPACGKEKGEVKTLKIGVILPYTGPAGPWADQIDQGMEWVKDKINTAGGIEVGADTYMISLVKADTKLTGSVATQEANRLVYDEGIHYVVGPILVAQATNPIFTEGKCFSAIIAVSSSLELGSQYPYTWCTLPDIPGWVDSFFKMAFDLHPEIKTIGLIGTHTGLGDQYFEANRAAAEHYGRQVVHEAFFEMGTVDFFPVLTRLVDENPDAISLCGGPGVGDQALIVKQARELGYTGLFIGANHGTEDTLVDVAGVESAEGFMTNAPVYTSDIYPEAVHQLYAEFQQRYGGVPFELTQYLAYGAVMLYKQAMEEADSIDPDEVRAVFDDPDWEFEWFGMPGRQLGGLQTFGIRRANQDQNCLSVVHNGKREAVDCMGWVIP